MTSPPSTPDTEPHRGPLTAHQSSLLEAGVLLAVVLCCGWIFSLPLRSHSPMGYAQDDFYYYLKAAQNMAAGRGSTFDGSTLTNGYHPLYFLLWAVASVFVHSLRGVFRLLWLLDVASAAAILLAVRRIFRCMTADPLLSNAAAVAVLLPCVATISMQMETTLALPLGFAFLATGFVAPARYTARRCAVLGLLGALTMLARLDAGILVCLFLLGLLCSHAMRAVLKPRNMAAFSMASLPLLCLYFATNRHYFHEWLPISGSAKQLRHGWQPDLHLLHLSFAGFSLLFLLITFVAIVAAWLKRQSLQPQEKVMCAAALLMPLVFYTLEVFLSDWKLWGWYLYALRFSLLAAVALALIAFRLPTAGRSPVPVRGPWPVWVSPVLLAAALLAMLGTHYKVDPAMIAIANEATHLNDFARSHPGRYAMGDRAGMFGYLSSSPVLQAEGLMMDRHYLNHIRLEDDLVTTLRQYHVDFYVHYVFDAEAPERTRQGCLLAQEPSNTGRYALHMRSLLCSPPAATLRGSDGTYYVYYLPAVK